MGLGTGQVPDLGKVEAGDKEGEALNGGRGAGGEIGRSSLPLGVTDLPNQDGKPELVKYEIDLFV